MTDWRTVGVMVNKIKGGRSYSYGRTDVRYVYIRTIVISLQQIVEIGNRFTEIRSILAVLVSRISRSHGVRNTVHSFRSESPSNLQQLPTSIAARGVSRKPPAAARLIGNAFPTTCALISLQWNYSVTHEYRNICICSTEVSMELLRTGRAQRVQ